MDWFWTWGGEVSDTAKMMDYSPIPAARLAVFMAKRFTAGTAVILVKCGTTKD